MNGLHVHIGAAEFLAFLPMLLIAGYTLRVLSAHLVVSDNPQLAAIGRALSFIY